MNTINLRFFAAFAFFTIPGAAFAQTVSDNFEVRINIEEACEIISTQTLNFGTTGVLSGVIDEEAAISVVCTNTTSYRLDLDEGQGDGATTTTRLMTGPGDATVAYQLFSNPGRTINWGNTPLSDTVAGTGTGSAQPFTVYGRVIAQTSPEPGIYTDTIMVTVTY